MNRPTSFRLLGKMWRFEWLPKLKASKYGDCDHQQLRVRLSEKFPLSHQADTMLHEVVHAIELELMLKMKERQVRLLSTALLGWMLDNPDQLRWILHAARRSPGSS